MWKEKLLKLLLKNKNIKKGRKYFLGHLYFPPFITAEKKPYLTKNKKHPLIFNLYSFTNSQMARRIGGNSLTIVVRMVQRLSTREDDGFSIITSSPVKLFKGYGF